MCCAAMEKQETTGMGKSIKQTSTDSQSKKYGVIWMNQVERTGFPLYFVVVSIRKCFSKLGNDIYNNKKECYEAVSV